LVQRVEDQPYYPALFADAFGDNAVTTDRIARAIAQFQRAMVSFNSKYDVGRAQVGNPGTPFPNFTAQENQGKNLFNAPPPNGFNCASCHDTESHINAAPGPFNIGLDSPPLVDEGAFNTFGTNNFRGSFKVPSLRNVGIRPPFMHDGRFATLDDVIDFYSTGVQAHPNLAPQLTTNNQRGGPPVAFNMTQAEKDALVAFLETLTDFDFLADEKFSDPFPVLPDPNVEQVVIHDGLPGRSTVSGVTVMFNREVNATAASFRLTNTDTSTLVDLQASSTVVDNKTWVTLTFDPGPSVITRVNGNSLADGAYMLETLAAEVSGFIGGEAMQQNHVFGNQASDGFFRLYGDDNGTGALDLLDFAEFRATFGRSTGQAGYNDNFDADGDGIIGLADFAAFRANF